MQPPARRHSALTPGACRRRAGAPPGQPGQLPARPRRHRSDAVARGQRVGGHTRPVAWQCHPGGPPIQRAGQAAVHGGAARGRLSARQLGWHVSMHSAGLYPAGALHQRDVPFCCTIEACLQWMLTRTRDWRCTSCSPWPTDSCSQVDAGYAASPGRAILRCSRPEGRVRPRPQRRACLSQPSRLDSAAMPACAAATRARLAFCRDPALRRMFCPKGHTPVPGIWGRGGAASRPGVSGRIEPQRLPQAGASQPRASCAPRLFSGADLRHQAARRPQSPPWQRAIR